MRDRLNESVAIKLTVIITAGLLTLGTVAIWYSYRVQEKQFAGLLEEGSVKIIESAEKALEEGMMAGHRDPIGKEMEMLGSQRDVVVVRVTRNDGTIAFSSKPNEAGTQVSPAPGEGKQIRKIGRTENSPPFRVMEITAAVRNRPGCINAGCHAHGTGEKILGAITVSSSLRLYDQMRAQRTLRLIVVGMTGIILIALLVFFAAHKLVHEPARELIRGVKEVSIGNYSPRVTEMSRDELGVLAKNFNLMTQELHKARAELMDYTNTLAFRASRKAEELEKAQARMLQAEKMVSLGKLAAIAAEEIEGSIKNVAESAKRLSERLNRRGAVDGDRTEETLHLQNIISGAASCVKAVEELVVFSKEERAGLERCSLVGIAGEAAALLRQRLGESVLKVAVEKSADPMFVRGDRSRLLQAVVALLVNAGEAMRERCGGTASISFSRMPGFCRMVVEDDGPGMEHEVAQKVFEPFFSTKETLSAVGLGLSVVNSIITKHDGKISLETAPGKGAIFTIDLPSADGEGAK